MGFAVQSLVGDGGDFTFKDIQLNYLSIEDLRKGNKDQWIPNVFLSKTFYSPFSRLNLYQIQDLKSYELGVVLNRSYFLLCARHDTNLAGESPATGIYHQV